MIDLKTIKNITISEGSVTKITNSSGVVLWQKATGTTAQAPCYYVADNVSDLPQSLYQAEYAQIGIQKFLITDYHWNVNSKAVVEFEINSDTNEFGKYGRILAIEGEGAFSSYQSAWDIENTTWQTKPFGSTSWNRSTVVPNLNQKYVGEYAETGLTIDGTVITATTPSTSITANTSHYVCIGGYNTTDQAEYLDGKIYSVKIYESGTLVRDIVPLTNGLFYDKLSKKVYAAGAGGVCDTGGTSTLLVKNESKYDMAYITSEKSWYVLNNKSQWEKYGVIELVSSLDNVTAYNGKLVYNKTDKHQYKYTNNAWTDQGEVSESVVKNYWAECKQNEIELYHITYHWGEGYHIEFESAYNSTNSTSYKQFVHCQFDNGTHGPIEIGEGRDSYYYDQHYPTSTTSNACDTSDFSKRTWIYSAHNANTRYRLKVWNDKIEQHKYDNDSLVTSSTVPWTIHSWYNGLYEMGLYTANSNLIWHSARFYDSDNNLTDEWLVQSDGSIKETLTQTVVQPQSVATGVTVSEYGNMTTYIYPVSYEQYDAPNLDYTECANEAAMKTLSCPYEGMIVKLTDTGKKYKFTYNSTLTKYEWDEITLIYSVNLAAKGNWVTATTNPDSSKYDAYMSNGSHNVNNGMDCMSITINGYTKFTVYIRSYGESNYDYTTISKLDTPYTGSSSQGSSQYSQSYVYAHTRGKSNGGTGVNSYTKVEYDNIDGGEHTIYVYYTKDSSENNYDDRGYILIPK